MKKFFLTIAIFALAAASVNAQVVKGAEAQTKRGPYETNGLFDNVFPFGQVPPAESFIVSPRNWLTFQGAPDQDQQVRHLFRKERKPCLRFFRCASSCLPLMIS